MLEIVVLCVPIVFAFGVVFLALTSVRRAANDFEDGVEARGWQLAASKTRSQPLGIVIPFGNRDLTIESLSLDKRTTMRLRYAGLPRMPEVHVCGAKIFDAAAVPSGSTEVQTEEPFRAAFRSFSNDAAAFDATITKDIREALLVLHPRAKLTIESGTVALAYPFSYDLLSVDRAVAIMGAIVGPDAGAAPLQTTRRRSLRLRPAIAGGILAVFLGGVAGTAIAPLPDHARGRAVAKPVVCPNGGIPDVVHFKSEGVSSWNVACVKKAESRKSWKDRGDYPASNWPTITTAMLSFQVYGLIAGVVVAVALGAFMTLRKR